MSLSSLFLQNYFLRQINVKIYSLLCPTTTSLDWMPLSTSFVGRRKTLNIILPIKIICAKSLHLCLTLCNPMNCSPSGSSVHGILQARISGWVVVPSSRGSFQPRDQSHIYISCIGSQVPYHQRHVENPHFSIKETFSTKRKLVFKSEK